MTWSTVRLADLATVSSGGGAPQDSDAFSAEGVPFVRAGSLVKLLNGQPEERLELLQPDVAAEHRLKLFPAGTVLFAKSGMSATKGHVYQLRQPAYVVNHLAALIPHSEVAGRYLRHVLKFKSPRSLIKDEAYPSIRLGDVENMEVPAPTSEAERGRIAAILDQADELRRKRQRALDRLNQLGQAIFHEMFGDIRTAYGRFGGRTFEEIADVRLGKMLDKGKSNGGTMRPYLRNANVRWFSFDLTDILEMELSDRELDRFSLKKDDLLICEGGEPGRCAVWRDASRVMYYQKALHRARLNTSLALPDFVAHWFHNAAKFGMLADSVTSATIAHLTGEKIKKLEIFQPSIDEQTEFVRRLRAVEEIIACQKSAEGTTAALFHTLQHRAFRGEITASTLKEAAA